MNASTGPTGFVILTSPQVLQVCLELQFIFEDMLPGVPVTTRADDVLKYRGVVYLEYDFNLELAKQLKGAGKRLVLYHLGDETGIKDLSAYSVADAIFRNYYNKKTFQNPAWSKKLHWVPNGYRNGLRQTPEKKLRPASERTSLATFIGWIDNPNAVNNERAAFAEAAKECEGLLQCIPTTGFAAGYSAHLYGHLLEDSVFAPCPAGNAPETIRLFDSLEMGCIPISLKHDFLTEHRCIPMPPIRIISDWSLLRQTLEAQLNETGTATPAYCSLQHMCMSYWTNLKLASRAQLNQILI